MKEVTLKDIQDARELIKDKIKKTDFFRSSILSTMTNADIYLKCENLQLTGSFKVRGALNKISSLTKEKKSKNIIAASSGNHAQGVALVAKMNGLKATIVMPKNAPLAKVSSTKGYGANILLEGKTVDDALKLAAKEQKKSGATFVHAFDDDKVIAGQGTIGLEILEDVQDIDTILCPIGGGGLISGIAIAAKSLKPSIKIVGVEVENFPAVKESLEQGKIVKRTLAPTVADGIAVKQPGVKTFKIIQEYIDHIVTVKERHISKAILYLMEKEKLIAEGAGAVTVAALLNELYIPKKGEKIATIVSGGNIDVSSLKKIIEHALIADGRNFSFTTKISNETGGLTKLTEITNNLKSNIVNVNLRRSFNENSILGVLDARIELETFDKDHIEKIKKALEENGFEINKIK